MSSRRPSERQPIEDIYSFEGDGTDFVQDVVATPLEYIKYTAVVTPSPGRNLSPSRPRGILR